MSVTGRSRPVALLTMLDTLVKNRAFGQARDALTRVPVRPERTTRNWRQSGGDITARRLSVLPGGAQVPGNEWRRDGELLSGREPPVRLSSASYPHRRCSTAA